MVQIRRVIVIAVVALIFGAVPSLNAAQVLFTPTLSLSARYTDNIDLDPEDEKEDYITSVGLSLNGEVLWRTAGLSLTYSPSYEKYAVDEDLDRWRHSASLYTWKRIMRNTQIEFRNTFLRSNDPQDKSDDIAPDDNSQGPIIEADRNRRGRFEYETNVAQIGIDHQFGADDSIYAAFSYRTLREVDPPSNVDLDDNDIASSSIGLIYNFTTQWGMELDASYRAGTYVNKTDRGRFDGRARFLRKFNRTFSGFVDYRHTTLNYENDGDAEEDYAIYQPSLGISARFDENSLFEIAVAYIILDNEISEDKEDWDITLKAFKRWVSRRSFFNLIGASGYEIDDYGVRDNGLTLYFEGRAEAGYSFTDRFSGSIYGSYRNDDYIVETPSRIEQRLGTGVRFDWRALQWVNIGLSYGYSTVLSDLEADEYTENRVMLTVRMSPTAPYRLN